MYHLGKSLESAKWVACLSSKTVEAIRQQINHNLCALRLCNIKQLLWWVNPKLLF